MTRSRLLILGLAIGSAVVAAMLAKGFLIAPDPERQVVEINRVPTTEVLVAAADLPLGDKLTPGNVSWQSWPKDAVKPQMITREARPEAPAQLENARLRAPIFEGEPVSDEARHAQLLRLHGGHAAQGHARHLGRHHRRDRCRRLHPSQ